MIQLYNYDGVDYWRNQPDNAFDSIISDPPYDAVLDITELRRVCKGNIILFCKPENQYCKADEYLFWVKTPSTKNYSKHPGRFVEMILVMRGPTFNMLHWSQMTGVYDDKLLATPRHPYGKPLTLLERLVRIYTKPDDLIFDPFCGSGTTLLATRGLGRRALGRELMPEYYALAKTKLGI